MNQAPTQKGPYPSSKGGFPGESAAQKKYHAGNNESACTGGDRIGWGEKKIPRLNHLGSANTQLISAKANTKNKSHLSPQGKKEKGGVE